MSSDEVRATIVTTGYGTDSEYNNNNEASLEHVLTKLSKLTSRFLKPHILSGRVGTYYVRDRVVSRPVTGTSLGVE